MAEGAVSLSRYTNAGLWQAERLFVEAHPRAAQYLDQAPILVMWALPWVASLNDSAGSFAKAWVASLCEDGVGLKDFLRAASMSAPMREISAKVLLPKHAGTYRMLARIRPEVLGQTIPVKATAQRAWLRALDAWLAAARRRRLIENIDPTFEWCATRFAGADISTAQASDLYDFHLHGVFNRAWGLKRAVEEMDLWHTRITLDRALAGLPVGADTEIDMGDHKAVSVDGYAITPLRTPRQITEEGTAMRHCVATYLKRVIDGHSHIVSITRDGRRVATLDFGRSFQIRGPRNSQVSPVVSSLARLYVEVQAEHDARPSPVTRRGR